MNEAMGVPRLSTATTIKTSLEQTLMFVAYHLNIGIDHMFLFFDDPYDPAIESLAKHEQVTCIPCSSEYWAQRGLEQPKKTRNSIRQRISVTEALATARQMGYDWLFHIDSDELIYPGAEDLKQFFATADCDVVRLELYEAIPQVGGDSLPEIPFSATLFKREASERQMALAKALFCKKAFFCNSYLRGHLRSKVGVRTDSNIEKMGVHAPEEQEFSLLKTKAIWLLHYDFSNFSSWKEKWSMRLRGEYIGSLNRHRRAQFELFKGSHEGGEDSLLRAYQTLYKLPRYERFTLTQLQLLKTIHIDRSLFVMSS